MCLVILEYLESQEKVCLHTSVFTCTSYVHAFCLLHDIIWCTCVTTLLCVLNILVRLDLWYTYTCACSYVDLWQPYLFQLDFVWITVFFTP